MQDLAINLGALSLFGFLLRGDLQAREKQMARLQREERLGSLQLELANGKVVRMAQLRWVPRPKQPTAPPCKERRPLRSIVQTRAAEHDRCGAFGPSCLSSFEAGLCG